MGFKEGSLMCRLTRKSVLTATILAAGFTPGAGAQVPHRWNADGAIGVGTGKGGEYRDNDRGAARLAITGRVVQRGRLAVYAEAGYDWLGLSIGGTRVCVVASGGGCRPPYPDIAGPSASAGVLLAPTTRLELRAGLGGAAYAVDGTRLGAAIGQLDLAGFPAEHIGWIVGARLVEIPRYRHDRLTMVPVLLGLRVR